MTEKSKPAKPTKPNPGTISFKPDGPTIIDPVSLKEVPLDISYALKQIDTHNNSNPESSIGRKITKWRDNLKSEYKLPEIVAEMQKECRGQKGLVYRKIGSWAHLINMVVMSEIVTENKRKVAMDKAKEDMQKQLAAEGKVKRYD